MADANLGKREALERVAAGEPAPREATAGIAKEVAASDEKLAILMKKVSDASNKDHVANDRSKAVNKITDAYKRVVTVVKHHVTAQSSSDPHKPAIEGEKTSILEILGTVSSDAVSKDNILAGMLTLARTLFRSPLDGHKRLAGVLLSAVAESLPEKSKSSV